jgi:hypothetical protein
MLALARYVFMLFAVTTLVATATAQSPSADESEEIVGYQRECKTDVSTANSTLIAARILSDDGKQLARSDYANWSPKAYGAQEPNISVTWFTYSGYSGNYLTLRQVDGYVQLFFRKENKLPRTALWRYKRLKSINSDSALTAVISTNADKRLASTRFGFKDLLSFGGGVDELAWTMEGLPSYSKPAKVYFSGSTDLVLLREAETALNKAADKLDEMQRTFETSCTRTPVFYNANAEIIVTSAEVLAKST